MANTIAIIVGSDHAARIRRIATATVGIDVVIAADLATAPSDRPILVIGDARQPRDPRIAHVACPALHDDQLQALVCALATDRAIASTPSLRPPRHPAEAHAVKRAFAASRKLATVTDLAIAEACAIDAVIELIDVERAHCVFYDATSGALWSEARERAGGDDRRATSGMIGWAVRTGLACSAAIASEDARYVAHIDDPGGDPAAQIMVQPIVGGDARAHAVLVALRRAGAPPLGLGDAALLDRFAALAAPLLEQLSSHAEAQQLLDGERGSLFRPEAVAAASDARWGDVVRVAPGWLPWAYRLLAVVLASACAVIALYHLTTYSTGTAIIRSLQRVPAVTRTTGNVAAVIVAPGDRVAAGAVIARLDDTKERADAERVEREYDDQLRNHMLDPSEPAADQAVRSLGVELAQARGALDERAIRAAAPGRIADVRVRAGQHVEPGDIAATIVDGDGGLEVIALLPGADRPQLAPNMTMRLELAGYRYAYQALAIDSVSDDVISPSEARRVLGAEVADSVHIDGPVVVVRGRLREPTFEVDGATYRYHDGMLGQAEVSVRQERIVFALLPGVRRLL